MGYARQKSLKMLASTLTTPTRKDVIMLLMACTYIKMNNSNFILALDMRLWAHFIVVEGKCSLEHGHCPVVCAQRGSDANPFASPYHLTIGMVVLHWAINMQSQPGDWNLVISW